MSLNGNLGLGILLDVEDLATSKLDRFGAALKRTHGLSEEAVAGVSANLKSLGMGAAVLGAGIAGLAVLGPALQEARDYGAAIASVATETDAAKFSTEEMRKITRGLAGEFGRLPVDEAKSLYEAVGMGADTAAKSTDLLTAANRLAVAGNADLKTSTDALGGAIRAYGADWSQAGAFADTVFTAMVTGKTNVQELAASLGRVTSMSSALGLSFQETTAAISAMTSTGISADMAVTGLHEAFANVLHVESKAAAEAQRLGIQFNTLTLKNKGLHGLLEDITNARGFAGVETMKKLFPSVEGFNAVMQITAGNMRGFTDALDAMKSSAGATERGVKIMTEELKFQEDRFGALKKIALGLIGEALEPLKVSAIKLANDLLDRFNKLSPATQGFIVKGFALASTLAVVVGGLVAAKAATGILSLAMAASGGTITAAFLPAIAVLGGVAAAFVVFREAYDRNLGGFGEMVDRVVADVKLGWAALEQVFTQGGFSGAVLEELNNGNQGVKDFVIEVYVWFNRIKNFFHELSQAFFDGINRAQPAFDALSGSLGRLAAAFGIVTVDTDANGKAFDSWGGAGHEAGDLLAQLVEVAVHLAAAFIDVVTWSKPILDAFLSIVTGAEPANTNVAILRDVMMAVAAVKLAGWAEGVVAAIGSVGSAAAAANLEFGLLAAAILSAMAAFKTYSDLKDKYGENWAKGFANNAKRNLGLISDDEYRATKASLGGIGDEALIADVARQEAEKRKDIRAAQEALSPAAAMPAVAAVEGQNQSGGQSEVLASIQELASKPPPPLEVNVPVTLMMPDGEVLASQVVQAQVQSGARTGLPVSSHP